MRCLHYSERRLADVEGIGLSNAWMLHRHYRPMQVPSSTLMMAPARYESIYGGFLVV